MLLPFKRYWSLLATYLRLEWPRVVLLGLLLLSITGLQLANPLLLRHFLDAARAGQTWETLSRVALLFIGVAIVTQLASLLETYVAENIGWSATNRLRGQLAQHCLDLDLSFHNAHLPGELLQRLDYDVSTLANFFSRFALRVLASLLLLGGVLSVLTWLDWRIGLAFAGFVACGFAVLGRIRHMVVPYAHADLQTMGTQFGYLEERLAGTEDIRARGAIGYILRGLYPHMRARLQARRAAGTMFVVVLGTTSVVAALGTALAYAVGSYLFQSGVVTIGTVYALVAYVALVARPLGQLTQQVQDLQQATAGIARVQELLTTASTIQDGPGAPLPTGPLSVTLEHVSFAYRPDAPVLRDITLTLQPGTVLGLLGRTGCGKTTFTRLLLRLYDPTMGAIRLGGVDLREARQRDIRGRVGLVTQEVQLFQASVRDNLTFFNRAIPDSRILEAFRSLGLLDWYAVLPDGLDTKLAGATALSAGEAQLLALARVFLYDPGLVILDEASARLDPATERRIECALDVLLRDRTAIIVAHRLATVQRAREILVLEDGLVVEHGPRLQLARDPQSHYAGLLRAGLEATSA